MFIEHMEIQGYNKISGKPFRSYSVLTIVKEALAVKVYIHKTN